MISVGSDIQSAYDKYHLPAATEKVIGSYLGKPLTRYVVTTTVPSTSGSAVYMVAGHLVRMDGFASHSYSGLVALPYVYDSGNFIEVVMQNSLLICNYTGSWFSGYDLVLILYFTD